MKRLLFLPIVTVCIFCMTACSDNAKPQSENQDVIEVTDEDIPEGFKLSNRLSPEEIERMKKNVKVMFQYLKVSEDSTEYIFELSESEALKLGVDKEYYDELVKNIKDVNTSIRQSLKDSMRFTLADPQELIKDIDKL